MKLVIIYKQDNNVPAVIVPAPEAFERHSIKKIAAKAVPPGKPFAIVDAADLPNEPQETWTVDEADLTDGIGGESNEFS